MAKETITRIPLDRLAESSMNPRRIRDDEADKELAASIKEQGVLAPLLIRKNGSNGKYEILAGSRRYRAAKVAGLKDVPTIVHDVDDKTALEIIIIEYLQRVDIHPLDEAEGFVALLEKHGGDYGTVSSKVNKPRRYIALRAKLVNLARSWRKDWLGGDAKKSFTIDHALHLCRISDESQEQLYKELANHYEYATVDDVKGAIQAEHYYTLTTVPWDLKDAKLYAKAGACNVCPKRSGSNKDLFSDLKANTCTDKTCFNQKLRYYAQQQAIKDAKESGEEDLAKGLAFHLLNDDPYNYQRGLLKDEQWKRVDDKKPCDYKCIGVVALPGSQNFGQVWTCCLGGEKCPSHRNLATTPRQSTMSQPGVSKAVRKKKLEKNRQSRRQVEENNMVLTHAVRVWKTDLEDVKKVGEAFWDRVGSDACARVAIRRGWIKKKSEMDFGHAFDIGKVFFNKAFSVQEVLALMFELNRVNDTGTEYYPKYTPELKEVAKRWKVNMKKVKKDVDVAVKKRDEDRTARRKAAVEERRKLKAKASKKANKAVRKAVAAKAKKLAKSKSK